MIICPYCNKKMQLVDSVVEFQSVRNFDRIYNCKNCGRYAVDHIRNFVSVSVIPNNFIKVVKK